LTIYHYRLAPPPNYPPLPYTTLFRSRHNRTWRTRHNRTWRRSSIVVHRLLLVTHSYSPESTPPQRRWKRFLAGLYESGRSVEVRSEEHTSELQSRFDLVCRLLLEKKN